MRMVRRGFRESSLSSVMTICGAIWRRKQVDDATLGESGLARVLNTFDLTALGVGSTLGVGIYVLAGEVSKLIAGPAVVVSFLLAAIASGFAGLCYAEFGARVPKAGSAYIYSYYIVGELIAFVIGWSLILEYVIGTASVARGISTYIDSLLSDRIKTVFLEFAPMEASFMSPYVDFFAFGLCIVLAFALAFGVRESTIINNFLTFCNLSVVVFIIISGLFKVDFRNWQIEKKDLPGPEAGEGGFAPFGLIGIIRGAAFCFYGFIGFDCIATTGEEVKNPQRAIPISIMVSLLITFLAYFGVSSVLTLMWPYYLQDPDAPLPHVYASIGWDAAKWLVSLGALFGLFSSLFGAMFPLPRIIYAMASDGLIFRALGEVNPKTKTPILGTAVAGMVTATMAALFNLQQLISLMALGTLLAYTIVAMSVLILRYSNDLGESHKEIGESTGLVSKCNCFTMRGFFNNYFSCGVDLPTCVTKRIVVFNIIAYGVSSMIISLLLMNSGETESSIGTPSIVVICILGTVMLIVFLSLCSQPQGQRGLPFQMPLVPLLPCLSIFLNIYLMVVLDATTWIKLGLWMCAGIIPYLGWYFWKYRRGELGANSRYNINRVNHIKLNEWVSKLLREKKLLADGYVNEGFVEEGEADKTSPGYLATEDATKESRMYDEIRVYDEGQKTIEMNNNEVYLDAEKEVEDEKWRSVAEVHAVVEDECTEVVEEVADTSGDVGEVESSIADTQSCDEIKEENEKAVGAEEPPEVPTADPEEAEEVNLEKPLEDPVAVPEEVLTETVEEEEKKEPEVPRTEDLAPPVPPRKSMQRPGMKLDLNEYFARDLRKVNLRPVRRDSMEDGEAPAPFPLKPRASGKVQNSDIRERLNKILQEQVSFIRSGMVSPYEVAKDKSSMVVIDDSKHLDIKTLSKAEIMAKLQSLLKNGPPKRPSFRNSIVRDGPGTTESSGEPPRREET